MTKLKLAKKQGFMVSLEAAFFEKPPGGEIDQPAILGLPTFNNFKTYP